VTAQHDARAFADDGEEDGERRPSAPGSPWRPVAAVSAIALGAIGAAAAPRLGFPVVLGALAGGLAAVLAVLALPSLPTRRAALLMLGIAGLGALRHAALPTTDSALIVCWALATIGALVLVDRADAERISPLADGRHLAARLPEALRVAAIIAAIVAVAAVAIVPSVTDQLGRKIWPGVLPSLDDAISSPESLRSSRELDMTSRPRLSERVVFTVDAPRPEFWRGEVFDKFDGQKWSRTDDRRQRLPRSGDTSELFLDPYDAAALHGTETKQTFRIETGFSQLLFAAPSPVAVSSDQVLIGRPDGTAMVDGGFGKDAVYTVTSRSSLATEDDLRAAEGEAVPSEVRDRYAAPPATTARVRALAREMTAGAATTYDKVRAIEAWLARNTKYSLDAPLSPKGVDVVDFFLFDSRLGWCEQVSSSLTVLARSVGIPARLATGFVPGEKDGLSGRFVVRERDAHAWTEIYFPGVGWQGFDPTASVPLAGEAGAARSWMENARAHALTLAIGVGLLFWLVVSAPRLLAAWRRNQARRRSWAIRSQSRLERVGRRAGRARAPWETPREYARAVAETVGDPRLVDVGEVIDREIFAATGADPFAREAADAVLADAAGRKR
jgi:transglutaminase-like putative cysteine protease